MPLCYLYENKRVVGVLAGESVRIRYTKCTDRAYRWWAYNLPAGRQVDDWRRNISMSRILVSNSVTGLLLSMIWISNSVAVCPMSKAGWRTADNGGFSRSAILVLVKP